MRSFGEVTFRLRQELANLWLFAAPPDWDAPLCGPLRGLPDPDATDPLQIGLLADELLSHRFRLLGLPVTDLGDPIEWRRDFVHGKATGTQYFRRIPYLDFERAGDHKVIWELNRHQHMVLLAQAFLLTQRREYLDRKSTRLNSSHSAKSRMPSSA